MKAFFKSKTTWAALAGLISAVGGVVTGHASLAQAFQMVLTSIVGLTVHSGISGQIKSASATEQN